MKKLLYTILTITAILCGNLLYAQSQPTQPTDEITDYESIPKYVDPLPNFANNRVDGTHHLTVTMKEFQQEVLPHSVYPTGVVGTWVWGYEIKDDVTGDVYGPLYPAWTIEAQRGVKTRIKYVNELGTETTPPVLRNFISVDQSIHWANPLGLEMDDPERMNPYTGPQPAVVHVHGAEVPSAFDGGPDAWVTPGEVHKGPAFVTNEYIYPNNQEAATLWYHDHTLGATRLNVYAGLAGFYFLRDKVNVNNQLPEGDEEIEIVIQDRKFDQNGQLFFPNDGNNPSVHPYWIPEFFGEVMVVNGKAWPYLDVQPRRYFFHLLNGCNARFLNMRFKDSETGDPGPMMYQIASDGGYLNAPVPLSQLSIAPGERADVIIDFSNVTFDHSFILYNDGRAPFPDGDDVDINTNGQIMKFNVTQPIVNPPDNSYNPANPKTALRKPNNPLLNLDPAVTGIPPNLTRQLVLKEVLSDEDEPLEVLVNNTKWNGIQEGSENDLPVPGSKLVGANYVTEMPQVGATEIWQIINLTVDAHPIHLHLTQFQLLSRQKFDLESYLTDWGEAFPDGHFQPGYGPPNDYSVPNSDGAIGGNLPISSYLNGAVRGPEPNEKGWKDTFKSLPGEVMTIVVRFAPQDQPISKKLAGKNKFAFDPTAYLGETDKWHYPGGEGYVWHCHIIDHEDNEMMRPYMVMDTAQISLNKISSGEQFVVDFSLGQNYPNPFNPTTKINFSVPETAPVTMKLYNILGKEIETLVNQTLTKGRHTLVFNASNLPSGVYFYTMATGSYVSTKKMMLLK